MASRYILLYLVLNHAVRCDELLQGPLNFWALARASQHLEDVCGVYEKYEKLFLFFFFFELFGLGILLPGLLVLALWDFIWV